MTWQIGDTLAAWRTRNATTIAPTTPPVVGAPAPVTAYDPVTGRLAIGGVEVGNTGRRIIITSAQLTTAFGGTVTGAGITISRHGNVVFLEFSATNASGSSLNAATLGTIPTGFRPSVVGRMLLSRVNGFGTSAALGFTPAGTVFGIYDLPALSTWGAWPVEGVISYTTPDAWPVTLPGVAV